MILSTLYFNNHTTKRSFFFKTYMHTSHKLHNLFKMVLRVKKQARRGSQIKTGEIDLFGHRGCFYDAETKYCEVYLLLKQRLIITTNRHINIPCQPRPVMATAYRRHNNSFVISFYAEFFFNFDKLIENGSSCI